MTVKLGFVDTRMTWGLATKIPIASPEAASQAILHALGERRNTIYYPSFWRAVMGVIKAMGALNEAPEVLGHLIGAALVGTFAGIFFYDGFVSSKNDATERQADTNA